MSDKFTQEQLDEAARVETLQAIDRHQQVLRMGIAAIREREYKQQLDNIDQQIDALHDLRERTAELWEKWVGELLMAQEPN